MFTREMICEKIWQSSRKSSASRRSFSTPSQVQPQTARNPLSATMVVSWRCRKGWLPPMLHMPQDSHFRIFQVKRCSCQNSMLSQEGRWILVEQGKSCSDLSYVRFLGSLQPGVAEKIWTTCITIYCSACGKFNSLWSPDGLFSQSLCLFLVPLKLFAVFSRSLS